jgi:hypothetical protein
MKIRHEKRNRGKDRRDHRRESSICPKWKFPSRYVLYKKRAEEEKKERRKKRSYQEERKENKTEQKQRTWQHSRQFKDLEEGWRSVVLFGVGSIVLIVVFPLSVFDDQVRVDGLIGTETAITTSEIHSLKEGQRREEWKKKKERKEKKVRRVKKQKKKREGNRREETR